MSSRHSTSLEKGKIGRRERRERKREKPKIFYKKKNGFSSSSWLSLSFLILDSKVGSVVTKVCFVFLLWLSPDSDGSESGWWTISI